MNMKGDNEVKRIINAGLLAKFMEHPRRTIASNESAFF